VYSEVGEGTTFNIHLPVSGQSPIEDRPAENQDLVVGSETILLVDDEEIIVDVCKAMLGELGYAVIVANDGEQALKIVEDKHEEIDLMILDLIMPKIDGGKTFENVRSNYPKIPVILSSGYALNGQATQIMQMGCNAFIQKPFDISELSKKIREVLDQND
jgi:CheY-like chemotaxis protein